MDRRDFKVVSWNPDDPEAREHVGEVAYLDGPLANASPRCPKCRNLSHPSRSYPVGKVESKRCPSCDVQFRFRVETK